MKPTSMVKKFRRSISFPSHPTTVAASLLVSRPPPRTYHVRSTSLPCRSHPSVSHLKDQLSALRSWGSKPPHTLTPAHLSAGLSQLGAVHEYLSDILQLPQTHDSLSRPDACWIEKVLDAFLVFADVYGTFQRLILALKHGHSAPQVAVRRKDDTKIALHLREIKNSGRGIHQLIPTVRSIVSLTPEPDTNAELGGGS